MSLPQTVYFSISNFWYKLTQPTIQYVFVSYSPLCLLSLYSWLYLCSCFVPLSVSCLFAPQCFLFCFCVSVYVLSVFSVLSLVSVLLSLYLVCVFLSISCLCAPFCAFFLSCLFAHLCLLSLCSSLYLVSVFLSISCLCAPFCAFFLSCLCAHLCLLSLCSSPSLVYVFLFISCLCAPLCACLSAILCLLSLGHPLHLVSPEPSVDRPEEAMTQLLPQLQLWPGQLPRVSCLLHLPPPTSKYYGWDFIQNVQSLNVP